MTPDKIFAIEQQNNYSTAHLHLNSNVGTSTWIAYGYSAYTLRLLVKASRSDESITGYSLDLQLPYTMINSNVIAKFGANCTINDGDDENHKILHVNSEFDVNDYKRWVNKLKEKQDKPNGFNIQTPVSHLVPKEGYIKDKMSAFSRNSKRLIDLFASFVALIVFSPLFLLCYIAVKREDGGPAIYKQERIGRFGHPFNIYKFRTMRLDAEKMGPQLCHSGGENDPRLTKVGKFLRAHHLDELPQLWNVFCGDMAFVGPRPERKFYIDQIIEHDKRYVYLYQIRPGVTSYATFYNGYTDTMEKMLRRLEYDLYYLGHRSFWFDCKILAMTFLSIVFGKKF